MAHSRQSTRSAGVTPRAWHFRLQPSAEQVHLLSQQAGARRWAYNYTLSRIKEHYTATKKTLSQSAVEQEITALKKTVEYGWLRNIDSQLLQQAIADCYRAMTNFFERRAKLPRFKRKKDDQQRFRIPQRIQVTGNKVYLPKIGWVKLHLSRPIVGVVKSATCVRDAVGDWDISIVSHIMTPTLVAPAPDPGRTAGFDLGVVDAIVSDVGKCTEAPRFFRTGERTLARLQRVVSRRHKKGAKEQSANYHRAKKRLAKAHRRVRRQRQDWTHQRSRELIKEHQTICLERLHLAGLVKSNLSKSLLDAALGELVRQLTYKGAWYGVRIQQVDRFYPSSQLCSTPDCDYRYRDLLRNERAWTCPQCGVTHHRDVNAAKNIRREGLRLLGVDPARCSAPRPVDNRIPGNDACGLGVRPATAGSPGNLGAVRTA
jgi:putative transposase